MKVDKQQDSATLLGESGAKLTTSVWHHYNIFDLDNFTAEEIELVLKVADAMKEILSRPIKKVPTLRGKIIANLFYEASTRTRLSFELAAKNLSADIVNISTSTSSVTKGESLIDTLNTLQALGADIIVMRHYCSGAPNIAARYLRANIINAGDGWHAHPTQALLDLYTIREHKGKLNGLKVVIVGDILHSRVARSDIWGLAHTGARITLCCPFTLLPIGLNQLADQFPTVTIEPDIDRALEDADVLMALRLQKERQQCGLLPSIREYIQLYQINRPRLNRAKPDAILLHPGPVNEGIEVSPDIVYGRQSVITEQVTNGVAIRMALFYLLAGSKE
jgi:aspartate carbamoyltransferase catalytic subunit